MYPWRLIDKKDPHFCESVFYMERFYQLARTYFSDNA